MWHAIFLLSFHDVDEQDGVRDPEHIVQQMIPDGDIQHEIGLVSDERLAEVCAKYAAVEKEIDRLGRTGTGPSAERAAFLAGRNTADVPDGCRLLDLLRRPEICYEDLRLFDPGFPDLPPDIAEQVEITVKYEGYIRRQLKQVENFRRMESHALSPDLNYANIDGLRLEAREKLDAVRPLNLGQAGRISGVSPADLAALMIYLER